ncbi:hypothetical protein HW932_18690 [Allochromatium humboldtianum]|uniref:Bacteriophage lambda Replication protein O N-terminal domain-containing protein n=1 Tax=Allochromatium humboldtianum TaxID=504901 RepID=A0A850RJK2_9GAMM|nr:hypothetical protein [Allochromatium humboldtianum]NVZ11282.1 hypothetical protein [Allochromatium humboldtianum]
MRSSDTEMLFIDIAEDQSLSVHARLVLVWAFGNRHESRFRVSHIRDSLGISEGTWRRIRAELVLRKILTVKRKFKSGIITWDIKFNFDAITPKES